MQSLTKREKILLTLLAFVVVVVVGTVFIIMPLVNKVFNGRTEHTALEAKKSSIELMLQNDAAASHLEEQKAIAEENSGQFYSILNTYTIGDVFNTLAAENNLTVKNFHISEYVPAEVVETQTDSNSTDSTTEDQTGILLKATADISVSGSYEDIMRFLDKMNDKSFSLNATSIQLQKPQDGSAEIEGIFIIDIYGVSLAEQIGNIQDEIYQ